jgi:hypothetical protein
MPYFYFRSFIKKFDKNDIILRKLFEISSLCFASIYKVANDATSEQNKSNTTNDVLVLEDIDVSTDHDKSKPITTIQSLLVNTGIYRKLKTISKSVQAAFYKDKYKKYLHKRKRDDSNENDIVKNNDDLEEDTLKNGENASEETDSKSHKKSDESEQSTPEVKPLENTKDMVSSSIFTYENKDTLTLTPRILIRWAIFSSLIQKWIGIHDYYIDAVIDKKSSDQTPSTTSTINEPIRKRMFRYIYSFKRDEIMTEMMAVLRSGIIINRKMIYNPYFVVNDIRNIIETRKNTYLLSEEYRKFMPLKQTPKEDTQDESETDTISDAAQDETPLSSADLTHLKPSTISSEDLKITSVLTPEISLDINEIKGDLQKFVSPDATHCNAEAKDVDKDTDNDSVPAQVGITIDQVLIEVNVAIDNAITDSLIPKTDPPEQSTGVENTSSEQASSEEQKDEKDTPQNPSNSQPEEDIQAQIKIAMDKLKAVQAKRKALEEKLNNAKRQQSEHEDESPNTQQDNPVSVLLNEANASQPVEAESESRQLLKDCIDVKQTIYKISIMAAIEMMSRQGDSKKDGAKGGRRRRRKIGGGDGLKPEQQAQINELLEFSKDVFLGKAQPTDQTSVNPDVNGVVSNVSQPDKALGLLDEVSAQLTEILGKIKNPDPANNPTGNDNTEVPIVVDAAASVDNSYNNNNDATPQNAETKTDNTKKDNDPTITMSLSFTTEDKPSPPQLAESLTDETKSNIPEPTTPVEQPQVQDQLPPVQSPDDKYKLFIEEISTAIELLDTSQESPINNVLLRNLTDLLKDTLLNDIYKKTAETQTIYESVRNLLLEKMQESKTQGSTESGNYDTMFKITDGVFTELIQKIEEKQAEVKKARDSATNRDDLGCLDIALYGMITEEVQKRKSGEENPVNTGSLADADYTDVKKYSKWVDDIINKRTLGALSQKETPAAEKAEELIVV